MPAADALAAAKGTAQQAGAEIESRFREAFGRSL